jgi:hypothetical protein
MKIKAMELQGIVLNTDIGQIGRFPDLHTLSIML